MRRSFVRLFAASSCCVLIILLIQQLYLTNFISKWNPKNLSLIAEDPPNAKPAGIPSPNSTRIPKILHQVFKSDSPYEKYKPYITSCLTHNPDWKYFLWRDQDAEAFIHKHLPEFSQKYKNYKDGLEKSDSIRYIVMYFMGGIYLDMDVECLKPMPKWLTDLPAFIDQERREQTRIVHKIEFAAMNSAMGSEPGHPFFKKMIEAMMSSTAKDVMHTTGPLLLTQVFQQYKLSGTMPNVTLLPYHIMSPLMDSSWKWKLWCRNTKLMAKKPESQRTWHEKGCLELESKNWRSDDTNGETISVHKFTHHGYPKVRQRFKDKRQFNITKAFGNRVNYWQPQLKF